jgi:hypothetical protein
MARRIIKRGGGGNKKHPQNLSRDIESICVSLSLSLRSLSVVAISSSSRVAFGGVPSIFKIQEEVFGRGWQDSHTHTPDAQRDR